MVEERERSVQMEQTRGSSGKDRGRELHPLTAPSAGLQRSSDATLSRAPPAARSRDRSPRHLTADSGCPSPSSRSPCPRPAGSPSFGVAAGSQQPVSPRSRWQSRDVRERRMHVRQLETRQQRMREAKKLTQADDGRRTDRAGRNWTGQSPDGHLDGRKAVQNSKHAGSS
jgi:hypothetical protein